MQYRQFLGVKYKVHGRSIDEGVDCYGLAILLYRQEGRILPDVYYESLENVSQIESHLFATIPSEKIDSLEELCIIMFNIKGEPNHIGIYVGNGMFVHATKRFGVVAEPVERWKNRIEGLYKVKDKSFQELV